MESDRLDQLQRVIDQQEEQSSECDEIEGKDSDMEMSPAEPATDSPQCISRARDRGMRRERGRGRVRGMKRERGRGRGGGRGRERGSGQWRGSERGSGSGRNRGHGSQAASADTVG